MGCLLYWWTLWCFSTPFGLEFLVPTVLIVFHMMPPYFEILRVFNEVPHFHWFPWFFIQNCFKNLHWEFPPGKICFGEFNFFVSTHARINSWVYDRKRVLLMVLYAGAACCVFSTLGNSSPFILGLSAENIGDCLGGIILGGGWVLWFLGSGCWIGLSALGGGLGFCWKLWCWYCVFFIYLVIWAQLLVGFQACGIYFNPYFLYVVVGCCFLE